MEVGASIKGDLLMKVGSLDAKTKQINLVIGDPDIVTKEGAMTLVLGGALALLAYV